MKTEHAIILGGLAVGIPIILVFLFRRSAGFAGGPLPGSMEDWHSRGQNMMNPWGFAGGGGQGGPPKLAAPLSEYGGVDDILCADSIGPDPMCGGGM